MGVHNFVQRSCQWNFIRFKEEFLVEDFFIRDEEQVCQVCKSSFEQFWYTCNKKFSKYVSDVYWVWYNIPGKTNTFSTDTMGYNIGFPVFLSCALFRIPLLGTCANLKHGSLISSFLNHDLHNFTRSSLCSTWQENAFATPLIYMQDK